MTNGELRRLARRCVEVAGTHSRREECLALAYEARRRATHRELNDLFKWQGFNISEPLIANGHAN